MKSSTLRAGLALACALGLSACGGGSGDLYLTGLISGGVTADGLILQNNGGDDLVVPAGATNFQFNNRVSTDDEFNVTVKQAPSNSSVQNCHVLNGKARANYYTIQQIQVYCIINQQDLTVTVNGLTGSGLQLVNGADTKPVSPNNGSPVSVSMAKVNQDGPYAVKVLNQPSGQTCTVAGGDNGNGTGVVGANAITSVVVNCAVNAAAGT
jgi:hypothetical protein